MSAPEVLRFGDDGRFPNSDLPVIVHHGVGGGVGDLVPLLEGLFAAHGWSGGWRAGVFDFDHYHSTAHEVLGVYAGGATLLLGGEWGTLVDVIAGDVVVIPAGVAHRCVDDRGLQVVAAYDRARRPDLLFGAPGERPASDARIAAVPVPDDDPVGRVLIRALWTPRVRLESLTRL